MLLKILYCGSITLLLVAGILFYIHLGDAGHPLVIHWSRGGIDFVGTRKTVVGILGVGAAMLAVNAALSSVFAPRARLLAHMLAAASLFLSLLILIAVGSIISVN